MNGHYRMLFEAASAMNVMKSKSQPPSPKNKIKNQSFERKEYISKWQCVDKVANYSVAFYLFIIFFFSKFFNKNNETMKTRYSQK